jgi:hypothetical protein
MLTVMHAAIVVAIANPHSTLRLRIVTLRSSTSSPAPTDR